ncbi:MAG TPA: reverse transcriptase family protein [Planctomycetaceae bacterium]|nr:reverse transcriptase family protein [Planctomycetaceae bacterium]
MPSRQSIARALAEVFAAGSFDADDLVERGTRLFTRHSEWLKPLAQRVADAYSTGTRPRRITIEKFLLADRGFARACQKHDLRFSDEVVGSFTMSPVDSARAWDVHPINSSGELASWLGLTIGELDWFADRKRLGYKQHRPKLSHYRYRTLMKKFGQVRLIEAPKPRLKAIQHRILTEILDAVPPHPSAHGFRRGRSIVSFAEPHVGKRVVIKLDLQDFFPTIPVAQVQALFRTIGYPETVADLLAGLCINSTPVEVWSEDRSSSLDDHFHPPVRMYAQPHLPQGAPTSPALANLCAYRLDCRLTGLANAVDAIYTRYADDLAFSGDGYLELVARRFPIHASSIAMEEGFRVHHRKTRIMRQGVRQSIAGVVVNQSTNVRRADYDRLKATLTNCIRHGAESQNRNDYENFRSHLEGRISFVEMLNPAKGRRLRSLWEQIEWLNRTG